MARIPRLTNSCCVLSEKVKTIFRNTRIRLYCVLLEQRKRMQCFVRIGWLVAVMFFFFLNTEI